MNTQTGPQRVLWGDSREKRRGERIRKGESREGDMRGRQGKEKAVGRKRERPTSKDKRFFKTLIPLFNLCLLSKVPCKTFTHET